MRVVVSGVCVVHCNQQYLTRSIPAGPISGLVETVPGLTVSFTIEFVHFLSTRKKYWLVPIFLIMTLFGGLLVLGHGSAISPLMYALF